MIRRPGGARLAACLLAVALVTGACTNDEPTPDPTARTDTAPPSSSPSQDRTGGSLRIGLSEPSTIDPGFIRGEADQLVVDALFDSLLALDRDLQPVPAAAASWTVDEGTTFTFTLRDATFHNGEPVTAQDFVRAFNRIAKSNSETAAVATFQLESIRGYDATVQDGEDLEGVVANDDGTLTITLQEPFPEFLTVLADPALAPVPAAVDDDDFADNPIGNGPFQMGEPWQHGQFVRVVRYDEHISPPFLDEVVFSIYSDDPTLERQWQDLLDGQLDIGNVPATRIDEARQEFGASRDGFTGPGYLGGLTATIYYFGFNTTLPPFDDPDVRRAFSMVMDREEIATEIMQGSRVPATSVVPPSIPGASVNACEHCSFAPQQARALLDDAGGPGLFDAPVEIVHNQGTTHEAIANAVADSITEHLGVETTVTSLDLDEYVGTVRGTDVPIFRFGWTATYAGAGSYLHPLFHGDETGSDNLSRFDDDDITAALDRARATLDDNERRAAFRDVEREILAAAPIAPLLFYHQTIAVRPRVRDFHRGPMGTVDFSSIWLEQA